MEEILHQLRGGLYRYLKGFNHPMWCRISSIHSSKKLKYWLVGGAITILKNISQWEGLSHILWNKHVWETTNQLKYLTNFDEDFAVKNPMSQGFKQGIPHVSARFQGILSTLDVHTSW